MSGGGREAWIDKAYNKEYERRRQRSPTMSKPKSEMWCCVKDPDGEYAFFTITKIKEEAKDFRHAIGGKVVRIRVTEIKEKP